MGREGVRFGRATRLSAQMACAREVGRTVRPADGDIQPSTLDVGPEWIGSIGTVGFLFVALVIRDLGGKQAERILGLPRRDG